MRTRKVLLALAELFCVVPTATPPRSGLNTPNARGHRPLLDNFPALPEVKNGLVNDSRHHLDFTGKPTQVRSGWWSLVGFFSLFLAMSSATAGPHPARGVAAFPNENGNVTVSWRLLTSDPPQVSFKVYRRNLYTGQDYERITEQPIQDRTRFVDANVRHGSSYRYRIHALMDGEETVSSDTAYVTSTDWHRPYVSIALAGDYTAHNVGVGDLDGDGVLDYVVKQPNFNTDPYWADALADHAARHL
jgi:hypothetical protein